VYRDDAASPGRGESKLAFLSHDGNLRTPEATMKVEPADTHSSGVTGLFTPRRIVAIVLAVLGLVFILQNRGDTSLQLLGFQVTGPQWLASLALLATGIAIGVLLGTRRPRPPR
jgi:lipopolysaccharide assembly protein A